MSIGEHDYEVRNISYNGEKYIVYLSRNECSCRRWILTWLHYCHAISCMKDQQLYIDYVVSDCYKKECYEACYASVLYPVNGQTLWIKIEFVDL